MAMSRKLFSKLGSTRMRTPISYIFPVKLESSFIQLSIRSFSSGNDLIVPDVDKAHKIAMEMLALDLLEVNQLLKYLQKRLDVPDEVFYGGGGGGGGGSRACGEAAAVEAPKVKEAWDVQLKSVDPKIKIKIIKEVRALTGLGLKEAKELVEKAPCVVKPGLKKDEAEALMKILTDIGAEVELL
jgi:large subunit ribosomal protein L7/L12